MIPLNPRPADPDGDDISSLGLCNENSNKVIVEKFDSEGNLLWVNQYMYDDITGNTANDADLGITIQVDGLLLILMVK